MSTRISQSKMGASMMFLLLLGAARLVDVNRYGWRQLRQQQ
ncbi:MAG: hypothetical protein WBX81_03290 [Nitrososphaeraceae archaeon]